VETPPPHPTAPHAHHGPRTRGRPRARSTRPPPPAAGPPSKVGPALRKMLRHARPPRTNCRAPHAAGIRREAGVIDIGAGHGARITFKARRATTIQVRMWSPHRARQTGVGGNDPPDILAMGARHSPVPGDCSGSARARRRRKPGGYWPGVVAGFGELRNCLGLPPHRRRASRSSTLTYAGNPLVNAPAECVRCGRGPGNCARVRPPATRYSLFERPARLDGIRRRVAGPGPRTAFCPLR